MPRAAWARPHSGCLVCNCWPEPTRLEMRALVVTPGHAKSGRLFEVPEPPLSHGALLVQTIAIGICGTVVEIAEGRYGWAPPGLERLIIGHESLGRVLEAPPGSGLHAHDLVARNRPSS